MRRGIFLILLAIIALSILFRSLIKISPTSTKILCPSCGSDYVWTPIGTRSENFLWFCIKCHERWIKTYPITIFEEWKLRIPSMLRDLVMDFIKEHHEDARDLFPRHSTWSYRRGTLPNGDKFHEYVCEGWIIRIEYSSLSSRINLLADFSSSRISNYIGIPHRIIWKGYFINGKIREEEYLHAI